MSLFPGFQYNYTGADKQRCSVITCTAVNLIIQDTLVKRIFVFALSVSILTGTIGRPYVDVDKICEFSYYEINTRGIIKLAK